MSKPEASEHIRGLYGMVDLPPSADALSVERLARQLLAGGVRVLQLRMKGASAAAMWSVLDVLRPICKDGGALLIANDRLDVALAARADGVHLGQHDLPLQAARALSPPSFLVGISTHNEVQARAAVEGGADYLGFGPCFPTRTKINPDPEVSLEALAQVCRLGVPVVAIGGITVERAPLVARAGASAAAVIEAVNGAADIPAAARAIGGAF